MTGADQTGQVPEVSRGASPAKPQWEVPPDWHEQPAAQMLLASYLVTGAEGKATITISTFPGSVGGELANVNRWRKQLGLNAISESELPQSTTRLDVLGGRAMLVDINGADAKAGQKARMVAAMVPRAGSTWFYKLMGDEPVVAKQKDAFVKFIQTVRYPDNG